jgi:2-polyprenyl-3-methyl-5-hydroxy-6-metoxy-1,4-benzoquinol methylase
LEFLERKPVEGLDVLTDRYSQEETLEGYEGETWRDPRIHQERLRLLTALFEQAGETFPQERGRAFEIGFGDGAFLAFLGDRGYAVSGIETSERLVHHAIREHGLEVATGTVASLEAEPNRYDLVLAYHVLEHLDRPSLLFSKALAMIRTGGYLFIEIPVANLSNMSRAKRLDEMIGYANRYHMHFFTPDIVPKYFEKHGFEIVGSYVLYPETHPTGGYLGRKI